MSGTKTETKIPKEIDKENLGANQSLEESQRFLSTLISNLPGYVYRCHEENGQWYTQFASEGIYELTGYNSADFLKDGTMTYGHLVHPEDQRILSSVVKEAIRSKTPYQITYRIKTSDRKEKWVWEQGRGIFSEKGRLIATEGFITDITEKKLVEEEILKRNEELATLNSIGHSINKLAEPTEIIALIFSMIGRLFDNNNLYIALYNESKKEISFPIYTVNGKHVKLAPRPVSNGLTEYVISRKQPLLIRSNLIKTFERLGIDLIGQKSFTLLSVPMLTGGKVIGVITLQDYQKEYAFDKSQLELLTTIASQAAIALENSHLFAALQNELEEKKEAEKRIKASLHEKELLLQEIHHRVKNNLQIMSSLLRLQSAHFKDQNVQNIFKESENRIKAMAIIHNKLYTNPEYDKVDFSNYIKTLTQNLFLSYGTSTSTISLEIDVRNISLNIDTAIPCGLIVNELVSNSLKYAFPNNKNGKITVKMAFDAGEHSLTVKDNGIGIDKDIFKGNKETLGLKLVQLLASQMDGTVNMVSVKGTEFVIKFKELHYKKRT
jgi:PAS domain S-box-containing protein